MDNAQPDMGILERNLAMIAIGSPRAAQRIRDAHSPLGFEIVETDEGLSATLDGRALASKRRPISEAERFANGYDPENAAGVCVLGFGIGHHVGLLHSRVGKRGVVVCYEPDVSLLRGVLERVDHTGWLRTGRFLLATSATDSAELSELVGGFEAVLSLGMQILEHPASIARLGDSRSEFSRAFTEVMRSSRTQVVTALAHAPVSFRNMLMNLEHYTSCAGVTALKDSCKDASAVLVAAGPSLEKNLDQLADPEIRERVVVIAVQTVLKPMLQRGIRPDFVTALDYHELSKRFYEGLDEEDVRGIRLVAEPKANPAILDAFPGEILCLQEKLLDIVVGDEIARPMGTLPNGGTVAHLSYYLARYLGCDPVVMIGQDLSFTDGQYYASGAAIHNVWSGELNAHNTIEMLEWQRIARMKSLLKPCEDIHGRRIFTDQQMSAYLTQFETDFLRDTESGKRVIDATEGGVAKLHAETMPLRDALDGILENEPIALPDTRIGRAESHDRILGRIDSINLETDIVIRESDKTIGLLKKMLDAKGDQRKIGGLIDRVNEARDRVTNARCAYGLCEFINQTGALNRFRADRAIDMDEKLDALGRQRRQIERDIENVRWTRDAAGELKALMNKSAQVLLGNLPKITRDEPAPEPAPEHTEIGVTNNRVEALLFADPRTNGLGLQRDLSAPVADGMNALQITVARLKRCASLDGIVIATPEPEEINGLLGPELSRGVHLHRIDRGLIRDRARAIGIGRHQASECWRGGMGMLTCYDEGFDPRMTHEIMRLRALSAVAIVGCDWAMVNPGFVDSVVDRHRSAPDQHRLSFSQAIPGLGAFVLDFHAAESIANGQGSARSFATIGGLIGYIPVAPQADPIAKTMCIQIDPQIRDAGVRAIPDSDMRILALRSAYEQIEQGPVDADTMRCLHAYSYALTRVERSAPATVHLEICSGRFSNGPWGRWKRGGEPVERPVLSIANAHSLLSEIVSINPEAALVLDGQGDPLMHHDALGFVQLADELGFASVELRTDLLCPGVTPDALIESGLGVLSVDLLANTPETYAMLTGQNRFEEVVQRIESILDARCNAAGGIPTPWIVPRITRCDEVYEEIPDFYDRWMIGCGCAIIDPLPRTLKHKRINALPVPDARSKQMQSRIMRVLSDGRLVDRFGRAIGGHNVFDVGVERAFRQSHKQIEPKPSRNENRAGARTGEAAA